ncbi:hypothetical protein N9V51_01610 [Candidatus Actinomarina sp.]|nr:hypothetical protein [Candidatus Actinomarina sp.]
MKKSINIGLILFLLFQACSSPENTSEIIENPLPTDPPDLENMPSPPPPGEENFPENDKKQENPPQPQGGDNPPPPQEGDNPPPPQNGGVDIEKAVEILKEAEDEVLECISKSLPTEIYQNIVTDLNPDSFESGIVIACFEDPSSSNNVAQPPAGGGDNNGDEATPPSGNSKQDRDDEKNTGSWYDLSIYEYSPSYSVATSNGKTGYGLNETGDILLSGYGFDNAGGANKLNHPVSISANYGKLAVTDRFNNRVLIWNTIPSSNTPPDLVLGQANFTTHNSGTGLNNMDFPGQVIITPDGKVLVADSDNNRVLVWTSFPASSGQSADYALPITNYVNFGDSWPWGVWSDGTKVVVTATVAKAVLFWNSFPGPSTSPDVVLTSSQVGTPRSILSDGNYVMLGDENANGPCIGSNGTRSTHVWTSWPTSSRDPDACIDNWLAGTIHDSKIYGIAAGGETMYFYDELFTSTQELQVNVKIANPGEGHRWAGGDDGGATVVDGKLFVAEYNGNRISVFDTIPTSPTEKPDWALLASEPTDYPLIDEFIIQNPIIDSNGSMLFVSSDFDRSLSIWKQLPGSSGATPDIVMRRFDQPPWDLVVHGKEIYLAGGNSVFGWSDIEDTINTGNYSFDLNEKSIGNITFQGVRGIAYNGSYFAVADSGSDTIYIWEGVPEKSDNPTYSLPNLTNLGRIDMNDTHLAIGCYPGGSSFKVLELSSLSAPSYQTVPGQDCPSEVSFNEKGLFIPSDDKIIGWNSISDALAGSSPTMSFGGRTDKTNMGTKMASGISWDGYHFWVGEYKFSNRLLGFLPSK